MKKIKLATLTTSLLLGSSVMAAELSLLSNLELKGDARVRGISSNYDTTNKVHVKNSNDTFDSRIRINLDTTTDGGVKIHSRIIFDNSTWGVSNADRNKVQWDEASILVPITDGFLYAGRLNDTYGTRFYGSHNDKIDLAFYGYTGIKDTLLYLFDFKAVEGNAYTSGGIASTGDGDFDAYGIGGQVNIDKLLVGGRYVLLENKTLNTTTNTYNDISSYFVDAFATGEIAGLKLNAQVQQNGDDSDAFGAYLNVGKSFGNLFVGATALTTKDGYKSGGDLTASYLTNPTTLGISTLGRVGDHGDTTLFGIEGSYQATSNLSFEAKVASHSIKDATYSSINKDLDIMEYNLGLDYKLTKDATYSIKYAMGNFDEGSLEDVQNFMHSIEVKF